MKTKALVRILNPRDGVFHLTFFRPGFSLPYAAQSQEHALNVARNVCLKTIDQEGKPWVEYWCSPGGEPNCPEGAIELPSDTWMCKLSKKMCPIQAAVKSEKEEFLKGCTAPDKKKEQIFDIVSNGRYLGFHHITGRHLCVSCEKKGGKKESFYYHYPWEFAELDSAMQISYDELREVLVRRKKPINYVLPLCASCCKEMASILAPSASHELHILEFEVNIRPGSA